LMTSARLKPGLTTVRVQAPSVVGPGFSLAE
jgi:hypothetical protein